MDLERLIRQLVHTRRAIRAIVLRLQERTFSSETPLLLATTIDALSDAIEANILAKYADGPLSPDDFRDEVSLAIRGLQQLASHLRFVSRAETRLTPWSLIRPIEKIGEQLHKGSRFIIRPQWQYNYSIREVISAYKKAFSQLLPNDRLHTALSPMPGQDAKRLYVLGFPYVERVNVLMHTLVGHELGHPIEKEYFKGEATNTYVPVLRDAIRRELKMPEDVQLWTLEDAARLVRLVERAREFRKRALAELICDLVLVNLFGLAGVLAMEEYALVRELDAAEKVTASMHYPPLRFRLRVMWEEISPAWRKRFIDESGYESTVKSALEKKFKELDELTANRADVSMIHAETQMRIVYELVEKVLPDVRVFVRERLKARGFDMQNLIGRQNSRLLSTLANWIPPDAFIGDKGHVVPATIYGILNAGWVRWLTQYGSIPPTSEKLGVYSTEVSALNRLLLKAIEYADLRQQWATGSVNIDGSPNE